GLTIYARKEEQAFIDLCRVSACDCQQVTPTNCSANPAISFCDISGDNQHCGDEYKLYNFYPSSGGDTLPSSYHHKRGRGLYTSGHITPMQNLMTFIGIPVDYVRDPWGRVLRYNSNITNAVFPPYTASVWFE